MGLIITPGLPDLMRVPCPACEGLGGFEGDHTEPGRVCDRCDSLGLVEVCEGCRRAPSVQHGVEVCGCTVAIPPLELGRRAWGPEISSGASATDGFKLGRVA
jgi:hypothetical protein